MRFPWKMLVAVAAVLFMTTAIALTVALGRNGPESRPAAISSADLTTLEFAERIDVGKCMADRGFRYLPEPPTPAERRFTYVLDDVAWARQHGYGIVPDSDVAVTGTNERYFASLSPDRRVQAVAAFSGSHGEVTVSVPGGGVVGSATDGCTALAQQRLYGDFPTWFHAKIITANLELLYVPRVRSDPAFIRALGEWSRCMGGRGFSATGPNNLAEQLSDRIRGRTTADARDLEIETAVAEATCARQTPLATTAEALDRRYRTETEARYHLEIQIRDRLREAALPHARQIVSAYRPG